MIEQLQIQIEQIKKIITNFKIIKNEVTFDRHIEISCVCLCECHPVCAFKKK